MKMSELEKGYPTTNEAIKQLLPCGQLFQPNFFVKFPGYADIQLIKISKKPNQLLTSHALMLITEVL